MLALWTTRSDGDLRDLGRGTPLPAAVPPGLVLERLSQMHGAEVVVVGAGGAGGAGSTDSPAAEGDALVATGAERVLAVFTADCAAVALGSADGTYGAVHAGWRGLEAGVVEKAVERVRSLSDAEVVAGLGPCIGPCCYAFGGPALDILAGRYGEGVRSTTGRGERALDLPEAVRRALAAAGVPLVVDEARCTACSGDAWSYRARRDEARQALLVWRDTPP
ncbi:MAG TPA: polyphenol oxidase family protein [Acidimicrobiales bacterium]|nr:polyphenol oxidase family protein [Acidimicrobiales bacterium]